MTLYDHPKYGLTVSDAITEEMLNERVRHISALSETHRHLEMICVRDDAMDEKLFSKAAIMASECGLHIVLESNIIHNIEKAVESIPRRKPIISSVNGNQMELIEFAANNGLPVMISSSDLEELVGLSAMAENLGCTTIVLNPMAGDLKQSLETTVALTRMASEGNPADRPIAIRAWCGEYALSMATTCFLRGGLVAILDDLDPLGCHTLDLIIDGFS